jgi:hypothetical protein
MKADQMQQQSLSLINESIYPSIHSSKTAFAMESVESTITRHKKELKVLDGETRAAIKKAKGVKGQKGKELLTR